MAYKAMNDLVYVYLSGLIAYHLPQNNSFHPLESETAFHSQMPVVSDPLSRTLFHALYVWLILTILFVSA